jgi:hypothetical protein
MMDIAQRLDVNVWKFSDDEFDAALKVLLGEEGRLRLGISTC